MIHAHRFNAKALKKKFSNSGGCVVRIQHPAPLKPLMAAPFGNEKPLVFARGFFVGFDSLDMVDLMPELRQMLDEPKMNELFRNRSGSLRHKLTQE